MSIKPLGARILVKQAEAEQKTSGGLYIPETAQEKTQEGIVIAIGESDEIKVKVNDRVIYDKYAGTSIKIDGADHLVMKMEDVIALVQK
ncbi:MAG TPA: co-chaperone GroES [Spirochaetia bacterium]|nr:co-chaperone GroES [Spirochaetia bacterium]